MDVFSSNGMKKVANIITKEKLDFRWISESRFDFPPRYNFEELLKGGCIGLCFGLESANQEILNCMNKGIDLDIVQKTLKNCDNTSIAILLYIIIGFPSETNIQVEKPLRFLKKNRRYVDTYQLTYFILENNSYCFKHPEEFGLLEVEHEVRLFRPQRYQISHGISLAQAIDKKKEIGRILQKVFDNQHFLVSIIPITWALYLEKFGKNKMKKNDDNSRINQNSVYISSNLKFMLTNGTIIRSFKYDFKSIKTKLQELKQVVVGDYDTCFRLEGLNNLNDVFFSPKRSFVIFTPWNNSALIVSRNVVTLLHQLTGQDTIDTIIKRLIPRCSKMVKNKLVDILQNLIAKGVIKIADY